MSFNFKIVVDLLEISVISSIEIFLNFPSLLINPKLISFLSGKGIKLIILSFSKPAGKNFSIGPGFCPANSHLRRPIFPCSLIANIFGSFLIGHISLEGKISFLSWVSSFNFNFFIVIEGIIFISLFDWIIISESIDNSFRAFILCNSLFGLWFAILSAISASPPSINFVFLELPNFFLRIFSSLIITFINFSLLLIIDSSSSLFPFNSFISLFNKFFSRLVIFFKGIPKIPSACLSFIFKLLIKLFFASAVSLDLSINFIISLRLFIAWIKASTISCLFLIFFNW